MIAPFTCVCMLLAGVSGLYLYRAKHDAQILDRDIGRVLKQTEAAQARIGVLRTEWAVLNEPDRLAELSQQHLGLRQLVPTQFVAVGDLGARLPAPVAPGASLPPADEPVLVAQAVPPRTPSVAAPVPGAAPRVAAAMPGPAPAPRPAAPVRAAPARPAEEPARAPVVLATPARPAAPVLAAAPVPAPVQRAAPPVMQVAAVPIVAAPIAAAPIAAAPRTSPMPSGSAIGEGVMRASALGGARPALPPPTPYGSP